MMCVRIRLNISNFWKSFKIDDRNHPWHLFGCDVFGIMDPITLLIYIVFIFTLAVVFDFHDHSDRSADYRVASTVNRHILLIMHIY